MNDQPDPPPYRRPGRYRPVHVGWPGVPFTVFLVFVSVMVWMITQKGDDTSRVGWMYLTDLSTPQRPELQLMDPGKRDQILQLCVRANALQNRIASETNEREQEKAAREIKDCQKQLARLLQPSPLASIRKGEIWRLVTPIFLHFGFLHILFNMMWLWQLGRAIEIRFRTFRFACLVIAIAAVSNLAEGIINTPHFGGMSGVIFGLFGFVVVRSRYHPEGGLALDPRTVRFMLIWLVLCFTGLVGHIANWAHLFGLLTGGAIGGVNALLGGAWGFAKRRVAFRAAIATSSNSLHRCATCGKTELDDHALDFRVSSDGHEYCQHHLPGS